MKTIDDISVGEIIKYIETFCERSKTQKQGIDDEIQVFFEGFDICNNRHGDEWEVFGLGSIGIDTKFFQEEFHEKTFSFHFERRLKEKVDFGSRNYYDYMIDYITDDPKRIYKYRRFY